MCERISRPIEDESRSDKKIMKKNVPIKKQPVEAKTQPPGIQRRINAGWLRLWRTVYPNAPPPTAPHPKAQGARFEAEVPTTRRGRASRFLPLCLAGAGAAGDRMRRHPPAQRRQGCHYAQASRGHRPDLGSRGEPV